MSNLFHPLLLLCSSWANLCTIRVFWSSLSMNRREICRLVFILFLGQLVSFFLAVASFTSSYIADLGNISAEFSLLKFVALIVSGSLNFWLFVHLWRGRCTAYTVFLHISLSGSGLWSCPPISATEATGEPPSPWFVIIMVVEMEDYTLLYDCCNCYWDFWRLKANVDDFMY